MDRSSEFEAQLAALRAQQSGVRALLASSGWHEYEESVKSCVRALRMSKPPTRSLDDSFLNAELDGKIAGLMLALALPHAVLQDVATDIEKLLVQEREDTDGS